METRPEQPPEGKLIEDAADRLDLSIREAARRAGISYGRWRQIVTGYQNVSPGSYAEVRAPAKTLAKMARVVGITPEDMRTQGQRNDAADEMEKTAEPMPSAAAPSSPPLGATPAVLERGDDVFPGIDESIRPVVDREYGRIEPDVMHAVAAHPEAVIVGAWVFPDDEGDAARWDSFTDLGWSLWQRAMGVAVTRAIREARASRGGSAAGLRRA